MENAEKGRASLDIHRGSDAEAAALNWLQQRGLTCVQTNFRCKGGEIDLIMQHRDHLVFVEVRLRSRTDFGDAAESVTARKQRRIVLAARHFLLMHPSWQHAACRFDVMAAQPTRGSALQWQWLQNAFLVE